MTKEELIELAQYAREDERHWTQIDPADRADSAANLAEAILNYFGVLESSCPADCEECQAHKEELGEE